jgi:predicted small secreted protein
MKRLKAVTCIVLLWVSMSLQGCYTSRGLAREDLEQNPQGNITTVFTRDSTYNFDDYHKGRVVDDTMIVGRVEPGLYVQVPMRDVLSVRLEKFDLKKTACFLGGMAVGAWSLAIMVFMFTPFAH